MKQKIIVTLLCAILIIVSSVIGFNTGIYKQKKDSIQMAQKTTNQEKEEKKVAVVNMDEGIRYDTEVVNYGTTLLASIPIEHVVTGLEDARNGLLTGKYSSYIILPTTFSENVESINSQPQQASIEYAISSVLENKEREAAIYDVQEVYQTLNNNLSQIYMATILEEFHNTQDASETILQNDKKDTAVLADVGGYDLREFIKLPELKMVENNTQPLELQAQYETNDGLLDAIDDSYKTSLTENQSELDYMKGQNQTLTDKSIAMKSSLQTAKDEADQTVVEKYDDTERANAEDELYTANREQIQKAGQEKKENNDRVISEHKTELSNFNGTVQDTSLKYDFAENQLQNAIDVLDIELAEGKVTSETESVYTEADASEEKKITVLQNTYQYYSPTDMTNIVQEANLAIQEQSNTYLDHYYLSQEAGRTKLLDLLVAMDAQITAAGGDSSLPTDIDSWDNYLNGLLPAPFHKDPREDIGVPPVKELTIEVPKDDILPPSDYVEDITGIQNVEVELEGVDQMINKAQTGRNERNQELEIQTSAFESKTTAIKDKMEVLKVSNDEAQTEQIILGDHLLAYDPLNFIKDDELREYRSSLNSNSREIESVINEQNTSYEKYVTDITTASAENTKAQVEAIQEGQEASEEKLETGLAEAKSSRSKNNEVNSVLLQEFTLKLPYTRVGQVENRTAYQVMANPVTIQDKSTVLTNSEQVNKAKEATKERDIGQSMKIQEMTTIIVVVITILLILAAILAGRRRKMVNEF